jgi:hypothetical protein
MENTKPIILALLLALGLAVATAPSAAFGAESVVPGERLTYSLRWEKVPAGKAVLEVLEGTGPNGDPALHFRMTARTNGFVDIFYKVRDRIDSFTDPDLQRSVHYLKKQREGDYKRDITVTFDWKRYLARYHNKVNGYKDPIRIMPGTYDPLSIFYGFREKDLAVGDVHRLPVTDGVKTVIGEAEVTGRESVETPAGKFDCFVVRPEIKHLGGVFKKSKDAELTIWITADRRKIPVMISSKVIVGRFYAVLTDAITPAATIASGSN